MRFIKRYWSLLLTGALIPLLLFLALNQLQWVQDLGIRERYRLIQALHSTATQLSTAIQNEIAIIPVLFDIDCNEMADILTTHQYGEFKKRWDAWQIYAQSPDIISDLYISIDEGRPSVGSPSWQWNGTQFIPISINVEETGLFMFPLRPGNSKNRYKMIVRINNDVMGQKLIPMLAEQYLFGKSDYFFRILDTVQNTIVYESSGAITEDLFTVPDIRYPLLKPEFFFFFNRLSNDRDPGLASVPAMTILQLRRQSAIEQENPDRAAEIYFDRRRPDSREWTEGTRWILEAVHKSGSLKAVVNSIILRNTIVSMGTLLLLGLALVALTIAVRRNQELAERQQDFIATVTHELKTPVAVIKSAADNLASGIIKDMDKSRQYGTMILGESDKLVTMVDRLLIYSRLSNHKSLEFERLDMRELISEILRQYHAQIKEAGFRVEVIAPQSLFIKGDVQTLQLALGNLVSNALKHAKDGAFIGIDLRQDQNKWAVISVRDHGPGIPRQERKHIFDAFYRGELARKDQIPGSGLGLNVVRRIIETHGGSITCEALGDLGALFIIKLPLAKEEDHG